MEILDIHTHRPAPGALLSTDISTGLPEPLPAPVSVGLHPWHTAGFGSAADVRPLLDLLASTARRNEVAAIGEAGLDSLRGAPLPVQAEIFRRQIEISEQTRKPLIIHLVKALDLLLAIRRDARPSMPWILHGFRSGPGVLGQLLRLSPPGSPSPLYFSVGPRFNPETVRLIPADRLLIETDDSPATITEVLESVAAARSASPATLRATILENTTRLLAPSIH